MSDLRSDYHQNPSLDSRSAGDVAGLIEALTEARDYLIGLGQNYDAADWPRDPYALLIKIDAAIARAKAIKGGTE